MQINMKELNEAVEYFRTGSHCVYDDPHINAVIQAAKAYAAQQWQDISTAPRDGTHITLWWPNRYHQPITGYYDDGAFRWKVSGFGEAFMCEDPTHWQPLPPAPASEGE